MTPHDFAAAWIAAWNAHDLEAVLAHYSPDIEFRSPLARRLTGDGRVVGIDALRAYWARGLSIHTNLAFDLETVLEGDGCLTLVYRNERRQRVAETFEFAEDGRVRRAFACYAPLGE